MVVWVFLGGYFSYGGVNGVEIWDGGVELGDECVYGFDF